MCSCLYLASFGRLFVCLFSYLILSLDQNVFFFLVSIAPEHKGKGKAVQNGKKKRNAVLMVTLDFKREDELDS